MCEVPLQESFTSRAKDALFLAKNEMRNASFTKKAVVGITAAAVVFEWSPLNEYIAGDIGATVFESGRQSGSFSGAVVNSVETGLVVGGIMGVTQLAAGLLAAGAVRTLPNAMSRLSGLGSSEKNKENTDNKPSVSTALALGNTAVVIEANYRNPDRSYKDDAKLVAAASGIILGANVLLGAGVGASVSVLDSIDRTNISDTIISIAQNPLTYISIFAGVKLKDYYSKKRNPAL